MSFSRVTFTHSLCSSSERLRVLLLRQALAFSWALHLSCSVVMDIIAPLKDIVNMVLEIYPGNVYISHASLPDHRHVSPRASGTLPILKNGSKFTFPGKSPSFDTSSEQIISAPLQLFPGRDTIGMRISSDIPTAGLPVFSGNGTAFRTLFPSFTLPDMPFRRHPESMNHPQR